MLVDELEFQLFAVHGADGLLAREEFRHLDGETLRAVLRSAGELADEAFAPLAAELDADEPALEGGRVVTPRALAPALRRYAEGGFIAAPFPRALGGLALPTAANSAVMALFGAACTPAAGYVFLTGAAARTIAAVGDDRQRAKWLPPMLEGRWFGTMCLSEPKAGSSLTHVTTRATRAADGGWRIKGQKMWISGGDHDLAENIVHLVLARIVVDDRPSEALSLFIVPRQRDDGSPNGIGVVGLNKKLGHRATSNCALAFGAEGECIGELLGPPHRGLQGMFHMMNEARIGVGTTAAAIAWAAYRYAARYAFDRLQGRHALTDAPARLVDHVDVRRMLLAQKAIAEGGLSLALHGACLVDDIRAERDAERRVRLGALLELLTPVIKHWCAERGVESNSLAIQVLGGAGYVRDHPLERHFRDQRLNPIHEGTNGILAIDLVVRKGHRGAGLTPLLDAIEAEARAAADDAAPAVAEVAQALLAGAGRLRAAFTALGAAEDGLRRSLAFASPLMLATGDLAVSWMWLKQLRALAGRNDAWAQGKRAAARHMAGQLLPQSLTAVPAALAGEAPYDALPPEAFADWA